MKRVLVVLVMLTGCADAPSPLSRVVYAPNQTRPKDLARLPRPSRSAFGPLTLDDITPEAKAETAHFPPTEDDSSLSRPLEFELTDSEAHVVDTTIEARWDAGVAAASTAIENAEPVTIAPVRAAREQWLASLDGSLVITPVEARFTLDAAYDEAREQLLEIGAAAAGRTFRGTDIAMLIEEFAHAHGPNVSGVDGAAIHRRVRRLVEGRVMAQAQLAARRAFAPRATHLQWLVGKPKAK